MFINGWILLSLVGIERWLGEVLTDLLLRAFSSELLFFWTFIHRRQEFYSVSDRLRSHDIKTGRQFFVTTFVLLVL